MLRTCERCRCEFEVRDDRQRYCDLRCYVDAKCHRPLSAYERRLLHYKPKGPPGKGRLPISELLRRRWLLARHEAGP